MPEFKGVYGYALTVDDEGVTIQATGRVSQGALGTSERRILFEEITDRSFRPANLATNGHIEIVTKNGKSIFRFMTGKTARAAADAFALIVDRTPHAGDKTAGRGLTNKEGVEGATIKGALAEFRALQAAMDDQRIAALFPGLSFDGESVTYQGVTQPIAGSNAVVDTAGELDRRPTLSRVAMGGVLFGALGALGGGLMQKKVDSRQVFLLIDGPLAAWAVPAKPDQYSDATRFAALFNTAAKTAAAAVAGALEAPAPAAAAPSPGIAEQLSSLAQLHQQGVLSDQEFADAKAAVLAGR
ncbi:DUF4429 domain-containing protein [Leifsonia sp. NPDC058194]|uniref:DUF4429 domain-containing protein n=1 Tax=Leifsonia sp. NPDC058194 TaxID=3346374 RepID=UPI0036D846F9